MGSSVTEKILGNQGLIGDAYKRYRAPIGWEQEDWLSHIKLTYVRACHAHKPKKGKLATIFIRMVEQELNASREAAMTQKRNRGIQPVSLGELISEDGVGYEPPTEDRGQAIVDARDQLEFIKKKLNKRELKMFRLSSEGYNGRQLADIMGLAWKSWPNQLMNLARKRLKHYG